MNAKKVKQLRRYLREKSTSDPRIGQETGHEVNRNGAVVATGYRQVYQTMKKLWKEGGELPAG